MTDENKATVEHDEPPMTATEVILSRLLSPMHIAIRDLELTLANQSAPKPQHDKLFTALAKAQGEIEAAELDAEGQAGTRKYPYATLASVLEAVRGPLSKNGLCLLQLPRFESTEQGPLVILETILGHSSGQQIVDYFSMYPPKHDPQGVGSALTYMRRYTAMAILGISGAADDDAEGAKAVPKTITAAEADAILNLADELFGDDANALLERMCDKVFGVDGIPKIPEGESEVAMTRIRNTHKRKQKEKLSPKSAAEGKDKSQTKPSA